MSVTLLSKNRLKQIYFPAGFIVVMFLLLFVTEKPSISLDLAYQKPFFETIFHFSFFGYSSLGESVFSLLVWGYWQTLFIAVSGRIIAVFLAGGGLMFAWLSGERGAFIVTRLSEALMSIPSLLLALSLGFLLGSGSFVMIFVIGISEWAFNQKWLLGRLKEYERSSYITVSSSLGGDRWHIFRYHLLQLIFRDLRFLFIIYLPGSLLTVAALEFLGMSTGAKFPGLGFQVAFNKDLIFLYPHMIIPPIILIVLTVYMVYSIKLFLEKKQESYEY